MKGLYIMSNEMDSFNQTFFQALESSISELPASMREKLYRPCAINCVQNFVLKEQQRQFAECNSKLDLQYEKYGKSEYFFADIVERGHVYEIGYPKCLCPMVESGFATSPVHCECSRQSILYVLQTLMPDKEIHVEMMHTVLTGSAECRFRVTVE
jgi:hypothetical protein